MPGVDRGPRSEEQRKERLAGAQQRARERAAAFDVRGGGFRPRATERGKRRWWVVLATLAVVLLFAWFALPPLLGGLFRTLAEANPDLMRIGFIADAVGQVMDDRPNTPAGTDPTPVEFIIDVGASSRDIIDQLVSRELVKDRLAFTFVLASDDALGKLKAGSHTLDRTMTPREVADALQQPPGPVVRAYTVAPRAGLRIEQITALLLTIPDLPFQPADFYDLAVDPPTDIRAGYPMLEGLPPGYSLEGFLTAGVFQLQPTSTAKDLLKMMLDARQLELAPLLAQTPPAPLANFYQVLTIASIVEAETHVELERATIAGVYVNRLDPLKWSTRLLNADPTVIYGNDTQLLRDLPLVQWDSYVFWGLPGGSMGDVLLDGELAGFQTYHSRGLPPWPIRSPSLASIEAVLHPDTASGYLYFVAKNDGTGSHAFARTLEEQQQNINLYLRTPAPGASPVVSAVPASPPTALPTP